MSSKVSQWAMLALALSVSAGVAAQNSAPVPASASTQKSALPQNHVLARTRASSPSNAQATPAQLLQPGAVVIAPPILRYAGNTRLTPDQPLLGRLNLQAQTFQGRPLEQPPAMHGAPNVAATGIGAHNAGELEQAHD
jgi:hypothetical protein